MNFNLSMEKTILEIDKNGEKPSLLMHACCAPCASACIERLKEFFSITVYFYNPNMDTKEEYDLRAEELKRLCEYFSVGYIIEDYDKKEFLESVRGKENLPEGGKRCFNCFELRLNKTAEKAKSSYDFFTTTLTISPLKNAQVINGIGLDLASKYGVKYLTSDFKKKNGYGRSVELSKQLNLYRQNYCGCEFSKRISL